MRSDPGHTAALYQSTVQVGGALTWRFWLTTAYGRTPTLVIFKNGAVTSKIAGADRDKISQVIVDLLREAGTDDDGGADSSVAPPESAWLGAEAPKGYVDVTDEVELNGIDLLNVDSSVGSARILFEKSKPSALAALETSQGKGKAKAESEGETAVDWIESDTDQQIMLFMPFEASLKIHSLQLTSLPPRSSPESSSSSSSSSTDEGPTRPKTVNVYSNRAYALGFEEAEDIPATQTIHIAPGDWDATTGTAALELRVVKFQKVTSLVVFVVDGEQDDADKVRIDRLRIIGEAGNERKMKGKLAKFGHESGE